MRRQAQAWAIGLLAVVVCGCTNIEFADIDKEMTRHKLRALEKRFEVLNGTYEIGIPDTMNINVPDHPDLSGTFEVRPDGNISYPLLNDVYAEGRTPAELGKHLADELEKYVKKVEVLVTVSGFYSKQVYAYARGKQGGTRFPFTGDMSVMDLLAVNSFIDRQAFSSKIRLIRDDPAGAKVFRIRVCDMVRGDLSTNIMVKENDFLYIASTPLYEVTYAVEAFTAPFRAVVQGMTEVGEAPYEVERGRLEHRRRQRDVNRD